MIPFPRLPDDWESTRKILHAYSKSLCALPETHLPEHPAWWHTSLKLGPDGMRTENIPLPDGGMVHGVFDLVRHRIVLANSAGTKYSFDFRDNRTGTEMADDLIATLEKMGLSGNYLRRKFENDAPADYRPEHIMPFWTSLSNAAVVFERHRAALDHRSVGPVQFWSHGFDLAFEWFGSGEVEYGGNMLPTQINLGFYPHDPAYFFSNPFPFEESLMDYQLELGEWHTDMFKGSILYYDEIADDPAGFERLLAYATAVYQAASPTLLLTAEKSAEPELAEYQAWSGSGIPHTSQTRVAGLVQNLLPIIEVEGPVTSDRAYRAYINGAGSKRVTKQAKEQLDRAVAQLVHAEKIEMDETDSPFGDQPQKTLRVRGAPAVVVRKLGVRDLYEVPLKEIAELMAGNPRLLSSQDENAIMRYVLDAYGWKRLTGKAEEFLRAALRLTSGK